MTEREIRDDWIGALKEQRIRGLNISSIIKWGFYQQDLLILCDLHEADIEREMIEDLLEDCNFHTECGLLSEKKYDECRKVIIKDMLEWGG